MKNRKVKKGEMIIYQAKNGAIEFRGDFEHENIWATQAQIAEVFSVERSVITKHIRNIFKVGEVDEKSNVQKMHIANSDKPVAFYSLDIILSVGYRTNSTRAIEFRKWANKILREYLIKGYTINRKQIAKNYDAFMQTVASIQNLLPEHVTLDPKVVLELIKEFASTWVALDAYDKELFIPVGSTKKEIKFSVVELIEVIESLRQELIKKGETTELFAQEKKSGSIEGIVGNVMQSFDGKPVYVTVEEKAANLLYFIIKDHPFSDGNKRSGAFAFIWFLRKAKVKGIRNINPSTLTAMTLLIAESSPNKKEQMVALVTTLLSVKK
ncbi:MAG: virulence protein RhuM/Fic/DOC family protein [Candidatus Pacebacteria bacterium]|nr:virulence protein RhuM/Fic/DOC family protein [Candidatus Paceibacterota bacterium]